LLVFATILATQTLTTWRNVQQTVVLARVIGAAEEYSRAVPAEAILSLGAQQTGSAGQKALIPAARARVDAAIVNLRAEAEAAGLTDPMALRNIEGAVTVDLRHNRDRVDAGRQTLPAILATMRPATLQAIELIGRLAVLSTDAEVSRLMMAYNIALSMNDAMLVERNVRPIAGPDGRLDPGLVNSEAVGIAEQNLLTGQFERLAADEVLPVWHRFLNDPAAEEVATLRRTVLGLGGTLDPSGVERWSGAVDRRLQAMAAVVSASSAILRRTVGERSRSAAATLFSYASLVIVSLLFVVALVWATRRDLGARIHRLCTTMRRLADGDLAIVVPEAECRDELGEMADTLASFKTSLIERERLASTQLAAAAALLNEKERLRVTLHSISDGVIVTGPDECVTMMNDAAVSLTGRSLADHLGQPLTSVLKLRDGDGLGRRQTPVFDAGDADAMALAPSGDVTLLRSDGAEIAINASAAVICGQNYDHLGSITVLHDVSEARSLLKRISQLAHFDMLTGLPNRALFLERLDETVARTTRLKEKCAILFLDLDGFKHVNDTLGHSVGDVLLAEVGRRLARTVRGCDTVARLGGDEFVVILGGLSDAAQAGDVARHILQSVSEIDSVGDNQTDVSFSIGIAMYPRDAQDAQELLMRADTAMYQAKDAGRNAYAFYDPTIGRANQRRSLMRLQLARSLQLDQFHLLFQPKVALASGQVVGAEALIRWTPEPGRIVSPLDFIPIAEETGLILKLCEWVVTEACQQVRSWLDQGLPMTPVSVNVSVKSLHDPGFVPIVKKALASAGLQGPCLEIEITESVAMSDPSRIVSILDQIRGLGVRVSIDDFGTGFSSLSRLRRLPIDTIKIDRSFVTSMIEDAEDAALVRTIIAMAADMRKHVVAEGVETEHQRQMLLRAGCREAQGYLFSKPVRPEAFVRCVMQAQMIRTSA
jgi:diguanylate cyclase (GGDEF)-like protein